MCLPACEKKTYIICLFTSSANVFKSEKPVSRAFWSLFIIHSKAFQTNCSDIFKTTEYLKIKLRKIQIEFDVGQLNAPQTKLPRLFKKKIQTECLHIQFLHDSEAASGGTCKFNKNYHIFNCAK